MIRSRDLVQLRMELTRFEEAPAARLYGSDAPKTAETAVGIMRLKNLEECIRTVERDGVAGDIAETGVWRGGAMIYAAAVLETLGWKWRPRMVWCFDSFEGLPRPDVAGFPADEGDPHHSFEWLRVPLETVQANFCRYEIDLAAVRFVKGWFRDTLPRWIENHPTIRLAVLRLDGDMYESTMVALEQLYPRLSAGGFLIVDDWSLSRACAAALDYRARHYITDPIVPIDPYSVFWRKQA
jgi:O-methyltransferase